MTAGQLVGEIVCTCGWHGLHRADAIDHRQRVGQSCRFLPERQPAYRPTPPPWWKGRMVGFDLETTGVDVEHDRIVTAAIVEAGGGQPTSTLSLLADPGVLIPDEAAEIHGITTEHARAHGKPAAFVVAALVDTLGALIDEGLPLVVFNAPFDLTVLYWEARRHGVELDLERALVVDPVKIDREIERYRPGKRKLSDMVEHWGASLSSPHEAAADALAACRVAYRMGSSGQVIRQPPRSQQDADEQQRVRDEWAACRDDLPRLHGQQRLWARRQAHSVADHFLAVAGRDKALEVRAEWPWVPEGALPVIS